MTIFGDLVKARAGESTVALRFEDQSWTYAEWVQACSARARAVRGDGGDGVPHVGVLLDNVPEYSMWSARRR